MASTGDQPWKNRKIAGGRKASPAIQTEGPPDRATERPWRSRRLLEGEGEALTRKAIELAKAGDMAGAASLPGSACPPRKDSPVAFDLPEMKTLNDAVPAMGALVKAVGQGDLTPTEAGELTKMVQAFAKIIETAELEERVRKLEEAIDK